MRIIIKVTKDGRIEIQYPDIGPNCIELGKKTRDFMRQFLELGDEKLEPCDAGAMPRNLLEESKRKTRWVA